MTETQLVTVDGQLELRFERHVHAPIEQVWRAVSEPDRVRQWFLPGGPWAEVRELDALLGKIERPPIISPDASYTVCWADDDMRCEFRISEHDAATTVHVRVPVDEPADAPLEADMMDQFLDRLAPYLAGDELTWAAMADLDATERRVDAYAARFGVDPTRGREFVADIRATVENSADAEPWGFEPSQQAADALEDRMTAYLREHKEQFDAANARHGDEGGEWLMTALNEWILPSATSVDEVGDRHFFVLDRYIRDLSIAVPDLESAWQSTRSNDSPED